MCSITMNETSGFPNRSSFQENTKTTKIVEKIIKKSYQITAHELMNHLQLTTKTM